MGVPQTIEVSIASYTRDSFAAEEAWKTLGLINQNSSALTSDEKPTRGTHTALLRSHSPHTAWRATSTR
jgi:hypothetical protein